MSNFLNVIVENGRVWEHDEDLLFGVAAHRKSACTNVLHINPNDTDMYDLLVRVGAYPTKIIAEQAWNETGPQIPEGYSDFFTNGKRLIIWNPSV